jgi:predicted HTH transcriptional regulator
MMTVDQFEQLLSLGREQFAVEFKSPGKRTEKRLLAQVIRACIGMSNIRDGGQVIIGVIEEGEKLIPRGLNYDELSTWKFSDVADSIHPYVDPGIVFDLDVFTYKEKQFIEILVHEFVDTPIICIRPFQDVLINGQCYVRTRRKPETIPPPSHAEMRDLLELASDKEVKKYLMRMDRIGFATKFIGAEDKPEDGRTNPYDNELEQL